MDEWKIEVESERIDGIDAASDFYDTYAVPAQEAFEEHARTASAVKSFVKDLPDLQNENRVFVFLSGRRSASSDSENYTRFMQDEMGIDRWERFEEFLPEFSRADEFARLGIEKINSSEAYKKGEAMAAILDEIDDSGKDSFGSYMVFDEIPHIVLPEEIEEAISDKDYSMTMLYNRGMVGLDESQYEETLYFVREDMFKNHITVSPGNYSP